MLIPWVQMEKYHNKEGSSNIKVCVEGKSIPEKVKVKGAGPPDHYKKEEDINIADKGIKININLGGNTIYS